MVDIVKVDVQTLNQKAISKNNSKLPNISNGIKIMGLPISEKFVISIC